VTSSNSGWGGFEKSHKISKKHVFLKTVTQNPTHSPFVVAHASHVLALAQRLAATPPEVVAALYVLFNGSLAKQ
jgi:hypothetical protein